MEGISYPLLSDFWPHGAVAQRYGVFRERDGYSERALFVLDKWGIIRYIDVHDIDKQPDNDVLFGVLRRVDPQAAARLDALEGPPPEARELPKGGIVMYCTSWCPACRRARAWFQARGLKYVEVDIETNPAAMAQVKQWNNGSKSTPTFDIEGIIITDFNERRVLEALQQKGMV
jgi:glutaredoxin